MVTAIAPIIWIHNGCTLYPGGSDAATRQDAARQVASVAKNHPQRLPSITRKVPCVTALHSPSHMLPPPTHTTHAINPITQLALLLASKSWETRVAAGNGIGHLAEHFAHHTPTSLQSAHTRTQQHHHEQQQQHQQQASNAATTEDLCLIGLESFNAAHVLEHGVTLAGGSDSVCGCVCDMSVHAQNTAKRTCTHIKYIKYTHTAHQVHFAQLLFYACTTYIHHHHYHLHHHRQTLIGPGHDPLLTAYTDNTNAWA